MSEDLKHTKIKTFTPLASGEMNVETESYDEQLSGYKQEIMKHIKTGRSTFLADLMSAIDVISNQKTRELTLTIVADERYQPSRITRTYTVKKEVYKRR